MISVFECEIVSSCFMDLLKILLVFKCIFRYEGKKISVIRKVAAVTVVPIFLHILIHLGVDEETIYICFIPIILISVIIYMKEITYKMILYYITTYLCICLADFFYTMILRLILNRTLSIFLYDVMCLSVTVIVILGISNLYHKYCYKHISVIPFHMILAQLILVIGAVLVICIANIFVEEKGSDFFKTSFLTIICIICISLLSIGFALSNVILDNMRYKKMELLSQQLFTTQMHHFDTIKQRSNELQKYRHDFNSHLLSLNYLLDQGEVEKAKEYIAAMKSKLDNMKQRYSTGNTVVDAILNEQAEISERSGVQFEVTGSMPCKIEIDDYDLCTIFSNLIHNAVENAITAPEKKYVKIKIEMINKYLNIVVKNSTQKKINLKTTKADRNNHGYGIIILQECVSKLKGTMDVSYEENEFKVDIIIEENIVEKY